MKQLILLVMAALIFSFFNIGEANENVPQKDIQPQIILRCDRDFGYFIGDVVSISYEVKLPDNFLISPESLPQAGQPVAQGIELREIKITELHKTPTLIFLLELRFQIFRAFKDARNITLPAIEFFYGPKENLRQHKAELPQAIIKISPLCGPEEPLLQPFFEPGSRSTTIPWLIVLGGGFLSLTGLFWLGANIVNQRRFPSAFKKAIREIRRVKPEEYNRLLLIFRRALNEKAGQVIFAHNARKLFDVFPAAESRSQKILEIIELHNNLNFKRSYEADCEILIGLKKQLISELKWLLGKEK